ncbi:TetR/AcrR family transcriptional regulator [Sphingomonas crocodyli]|uniref:TetR/AcrR family transcriptional regulator n=1 Tax=Sphingomonas crocodyli TaxID=1979270 RepID=A0A437LV24_9SPHN|nr:TetR/AcrR family transcriptional regulator [Sphingomonas crocodyli]RVT89212.1 TetR/AcrR family transcriptional regulator [Sphingomonas crocodyli]
MKEAEKQAVAPRAPRQARAKYKVELILEAAIRLLDAGGMAALTTNAVAETAGISIGTLYQYFRNKEAILDALADREMAGQGERIVAIIEDRAPLSPHDRVAQIVAAVTASYGDRRAVHRIVMTHALARGSQRLAPLIDRLVALLAAPEREAGDPRPPFSQAQAFVLSHAFAGVMRGMIIAGDDAPPVDAIVDQLSRLIAGSVEPISS